MRWDSFVRGRGVLVLALFVLTVVSSLLVFSESVDAYACGPNNIVSFSASPNPAVVPYTGTAGNPVSITLSWSIQQPCGLITIYGLYGPYETEVAQTGSVTKTVNGPESYTLKIWSAGSDMNNYQDWNVQTQSPMYWVVESKDLFVDYWVANSSPTVSLSVLSGYSTTNISYGTYKPLQWSSTNANSCSSSWTSSTATSGSGSAGPAPDAPTVTYSTTCTGSGGSNTSSLTFTVVPVCGDNYCSSQAGETATSCSADCQATVLCGNGVTDNSGAATETCDWGNSSTPAPNNGDVCVNQYGSTTPCQYCSTSCQLTNNQMGVAYCGDGTVTSPQEQCDGTNYNGTTCQSLGYQSGQIGCYPASALNPSQNCTFNTNNCVPYPSGGSCGDSIVQTGEQCDTGSNRGACPATCSLTCTTNNCPPPVQTCSLTSAIWSTTNTTEGNTVSLQVQGTSACSGQSVSFVVKEYDAGSTDDPVQTNPANVVFSGSLATGSWVTEWQDDGPLGGNPEYYFTATVSGVGSISSSTSGSQLLSITQSNVFQCNQVTTCSDYKNVETCTLDQCRVVDNSVPGQVDCGGNSGISCVCFWDEALSSCRAKTDGAAGSCVYTQSTADDCGDGFLIFSWIANWTWAPGKTIADDTDSLSLTCVDGSKTVECPSQIALPFFNVYNVIVILVAIALIYWAIAMRKSKKTAKKSSSRKKKI